jgi:hypothetical protein
VGEPFEELHFQSTKISVDSCYLKLLLMAKLYPTLYSKILCLSWSSHKKHLLFKCSYPLPETDPWSVSTRFVYVFAHWKREHSPWCYSRLAMLRVISLWPDKANAILATLKLKESNWLVPDLLFPFLLTMAYATFIKYRLDYFNLNKHILWWLLSTKTVWLRGLVNTIGCSIVNRLD